MKVLIWKGKKCFEIRTNNSYAFTTVRSYTFYNFIFTFFFQSKNRNIVEHVHPIKNIFRSQGKSLIMLKGTKWHDMRSTLSPAFTGSKMRLMFDLIIENSINMATQLKMKNTSIELDVKELFNKLTIDMTANTAFGIKINSFEDESNEFYVMAKDLLNFNRPSVAFKMLFMNLMPKLAAFFDVQMFVPEVATFFKGMVKSNMETREKEGIVRPDLINLLMQIRKGEDIQSTGDENKTADGFATVEEFSAGRKSATPNWTDEELVAQGWQQSHITDFRNQIFILK